MRKRVQELLRQRAILSFQSPNLGWYVLEYGEVKGRKIWEKKYAAHNKKWDALSRKLDKLLNR